MRADGVDLRDRVEAIVACRVCRTSHEEAIADEPPTPRLEVSHPPKTLRTDNGECNPYLPPQPWQGEDGG